MPRFSLITLSLLTLTTLSSALNYAPEDRFHLVKRSTQVEQRDVGDLKLLQVKMLKRQTSGAAGPGGAMVVTGGTNPPINPADTVTVQDVIPAKSDGNGNVVPFRKRNEAVKRQEATGPGGAVVVTAGVNPSINPADTVQVADVIAAKTDGNGNVVPFAKRNEIVRRSTRRDLVNHVPVNLATRGLADGTIEVIEIRSLDEEDDLVERDSFQGQYEEELE